MSRDLISAELATLIRRIITDYLDAADLFMEHVNSRSIIIRSRIETSNMLSNGLVTYQWNIVEGGMWLSYATRL